MSRFYMETWPDDKEVVSRLGRNSLITHVRGWNHGIKVVCKVNNSGKNEYVVYKTGGSNDPSSKEILYNYEEI